MELVRARPSCKCSNQSSSAAVLTGKCVYLNTGFLNRVRRGCQVQYALTNSAGDIKAINDILVVVRAWPLALASTASSVEKLSAPDPGVPANRPFLVRILRGPASPVLPGCGLQSATARPPDSQALVVCGCPRYLLPVLQW